jgi:hypothetical protein
VRVGAASVARAAFNMEWLCQGIPWLCLSPAHPAAPVFSSLNAVHTYLCLLLPPCCCPPWCCLQVPMVKRTAEKFVFQMKAFFTGRRHPAASLITNMPCPDDRCVTICPRTRIVLIDCLSACIA